MVRPKAEAVLRGLLRAGLLDPTRKVRALDEVTIPVKPAPDLARWAQALGATLVEAPDLAPREPRRAPREEVVELLRGALPPAALDAVPDKWEQHGDVLVMRVAPEVEPYAREVAAAFAQTLRLRSVLDDPEGVGGEFREMAARLLYGDDPVATHVEGGIRYRFDASRIMFSSGNVEERARMGRVDAKGETVVDMFAGIGYFTLPVAKRGGAARVHALEKNPVSFRYLVENVALNDVRDIVSPWLGDNRDFPLGGLADRVVAGYVGGTSAFLPNAFSLLKPEGGVVHYHDTAHAEKWKEAMTRAALDHARACGRVVAIERAAVVKSYSPGVVHAVLDVRVRGR